MMLVASACGPRTGSQVPDPGGNIAITDFGAEPRQQIRYSLKTLETSRVEIRFKLRTDTEFTNTVLETGHQLADFPTIVILARFQSAKPTQTGDVEVTAQLDEVRVLDDVVDPTIRQRVATYAEGLRKWKGRWHVAPNGRISTVAIDAQNSSVAREQLSGFVEAIGDASVQFPDAPIGIGATWEVSSAQTISGVKWNRKVAYRLREFHDATAVVDVEIKATAPSQVLQVEPNATTRVTSGSSGSVAEITVSLSGLVATSESRATSELNFSIVRGRLRIVSTIRTEALSSVRSLPAE